MKLVAALRCVAVCALGASCAQGPDAAQTEQGDTVPIDADFTVGLVEGDSAYLFGAVVSVAADQAGRIYVGDRIGATIRVYDGEGQFVQQIARAGQGPGEINGWPADITVDPEGRVYVRDATRITILAPRAEGGVADSVAAIWPLPGYGNLSSTRSRVGTSGDYYYPAYLFLDDRLPRFFYLPFRAGTVSNDTLEVPAYAGLGAHRSASYRTGPRGGRMLEGLSHVPFAPLPVWDVTSSGTILSADGSAYTLIETGVGGDTLRVFHGPTSALVEVPANERADSIRALDTRLDTLPVPITEVVNLGADVAERRLPATLPPIIGIHIATDGMIWVERWPAEGEAASRFYDVLNADGVLQERVVLRAPLVRDPPPFFGARYVAGVVRDADTGVERVVRFTLR